MTRKILFTDLDNTLYNWVSFFAPSFRAMVHALARELALPEEQIYTECKQVFAKRGSLDYPFVIQELDCVRSLSIDDARRLIRAGRGAFLTVQRFHLKPYPDVVETLKWLWDQQVTVVGITNSPIHRAQKRLYDLGLDSLLSGLVAWEGFEAPKDPTTQGFVAEGRQRRTRVPKSIAIPHSTCKPNPEHYAIALSAFHGNASNSWAIGDSLSKDLHPANQLGIKTVWARYGASGVDPEDRDAATLIRITHWSKEEIAATYSRDVITPDYSIDSMKELMGIIPESVMNLF